MNIIGMEDGGALAASLVSSVAAEVLSPGGGRGLNIAGAELAGGGAPLGTRAGPLAG